MDIVLWSNGKAVRRMAARSPMECGYGPKALLHLRRVIEYKTGWMDDEVQIRLELVRSLYALLRKEVVLKYPIHPLGQIDAIERHCNRIIAQLEAVEKPSAPPPA